MPKLRAQTLSAIRWVSGVRVIRQVFEFAVVAVLARLLTPADFGVVGMVLVFSNLSWLLIDAGFTAALLQRERLDAPHRDTAFWLIAVLAVLVAAALAACAPLLAAFYDVAVLTPLTAFLALNLLAGGLGVVPAALLQRQMRFRAVSLIEAAATVAGGALAIVLALQGFGIWSLAWQLVTVPTLRGAGFWLAARWRPGFAVQRRAAAELVHFTGPLLGAQFLSYAQRNTDNLLVGSVLGAGALGLYGRAYSVMLMPLTHVTYVIQNVMLSSLSRIQRSQRAVRSLYLRAVGVLALVTMPAMAGLFVVAEPFVRTVFGPQWLAMVPVLQILCLVGLIQPLSATAGWLFISQGRTDLQLRWSLVVTPVVIAAYAVGLIWGLVGVAIGYALANGLLWAPVMAAAGRPVGLGVLQIAAAVRGPLLCATLMAATVAVAGVLLPLHWAAALRLAALVALGIAVYSLLVRAAGLQAYQDAMAVLRTRRVPVAKPRVNH